MRVPARLVGCALALVAGGATTVAATGLPAASSSAPRAALAATPAAAPAPASTLEPALGALGEPPTTDTAPAGAATPTAGVAKLDKLRVPDLYVTLPRSLTAAQVDKLRHTSGVTALSVLDQGKAKVAGGTATVVGVDPSSFRAFTPAETAASDGLWAAVARGDVAPSFGLAHERKIKLASQVLVQGRQQVSKRVGALAAFGLPDVDLVADRAGAQSSGAVPNSAVVLSAPTRSTSSLRSAVQAVVGSGAHVDVLRPAVVTAPSHKPRSYRELYIASARYCPGLSWTVLAAIGQVESDHGRNAGESSAGALGPMQFLPSTWATYGVDGDGDGKADIQSPFDAVPSAAVYLCRNGAGRGGQSLYGAVFAYNHADWYVREVLALAAKYS